jgi:hypothetical protein
MNQSLGECFQEDTRLIVPRSRLEEHANTLEVHDTGKSVELILNLDGLGIASSFQILDFKSQKT